MRALLPSGLFLIPLAFAHACFEETGGAADGGTDAGGCAEGDEGCDCYGNGTCNAGLECLDGKCFEPGCTPGEELCQCNGGLCLGDLECEENVCVPPPGDGSGGDGGGDDGGTGGDDGGTGDGGTGGPAPQCPLEGDVDQCNACVAEYCCDQFVQCQDELECSCIMDCLDMELGDPMTCSQDCGVSAVFPQLDQCLMNECQDHCFGPVDCTPPSMAPECTVCAVETCCDEFQRCLQDPTCGCVEACVAMQGDVNPDACFMQCGVQPPDIPDFFDLQMCVASSGCENANGQPCYG